MGYDYDVVIIGGGSAGLVAAEAASNMGVRAALVERARLGGDCLWTGCVPSKALLASAKGAQTVREAATYGIETPALTVDKRAVWQRMKAVQSEIASSDDSPERFREMGVDVITGEASFAGPHRVRIGDREVTAKYALVCTGSRPAAPPVDGLEETGYLTNETIFEMEMGPESLVVIGGGPVGTEIAQAMNRLGARTALLEALDTILSREETALAEIVAGKLRDEGVDLHTGVEIERVGRSDGGKVVHARTGGDQLTLEADEVFVAAGRTPNVERLNLEAAGIKTGRRGIRVDRHMRTSAEWVYAVGDVAGRYMFTHSAGSEAVMALRNMFYPGLQRARRVIPWATFTDPELARVGLTTEEARRKHGRRDVKTFEWNLTHNDRARAEGATDGRIVIVTDSRFRILGAHVLAPSAGEMVSQFTLAIEKGMKLTPDLANLVQVYPTYATSVAQAAGEATYGQLRRPFLRGVRWLNRLLGV